MKTKITVDLPSRDDLLEGLRDAHPQLAAAETAVVDAETELASARARFADLDHAAKTLPAAIHAGRAAVADLDRALLGRDREAARIKAAEKALGQARAALPAARTAAQAAREEAVAERRAVLQGIADQLAPTLARLNALDAELERARGTTAGARGKSAGRPLSWPTARAEAIKARGHGARVAMRTADAAQAAAAAAPPAASGQRYDTSTRPPDGRPSSPFTGRPKRGAKDW